MSTIVDKLLKENKLSITEGRRKILQLFLQADYALVHNDIEKECLGLIDRVSVYRTLQNFLKKGLIHLIPTTDNSIKYALTKEYLKQQHHVHFLCRSCNRTFCIENVEVSKIELPKGFKDEFYELVITGVCEDCA